MKALLCLLLFIVPLAAFSQWTVNQTVIYEYDNMGNRVLRDAYNGSNKTDGKSLDKPYQTMSLYPNPASDKVTVQFPQDSTYGEVSMHNAIGERLTSFHYTSGETQVLDLRPFPNGTYLFLAKSNTGYIRVGELVIIK